MRTLAIPVAAVLLAGCVQAVASVVTLPVKVVSRGVDMATTGQSERDEKAGKELRKQDEARGKAARELAERCAKHKPLPADDCQSLQPR